MGDLLRALLLTLFMLSTPVLGDDANPAQSPKPKYGPEITLLRDSHEYLRKAAAPDYWALSPYYIGTPGVCACSTSLAIVVNAARIHVKLTADDKLATPEALLEKIQIPGLDWKKQIKDGLGLSLDQIPVVLSAALKLYGVTDFKVEAVHVDDSPASLTRLRADLVENEKTDQNFIILNFIQGVLTGDTGEGHISPLGAYDAKRNRVLVFDTDREWYEPYWVSVETLRRAMSTRDEVTKATRGYVKLKLKLAD